MLSTARAAPPIISASISPVKRYGPLRSFLKPHGRQFFQAPLLRRRVISRPAWSGRIV
jgi:hypothetical protein